MIDHIKISRSLMWTAPFLKEASKEVSLAHLMELKGYKTRGQRQDYTMGCTYKFSKKAFKIALVTHVKSNKKHLPRCTSSILEVLAHELAHLQYMDHSTDRWLLELRILRRFVKLLAKWKVKDTTVKPFGLEFYG